MSGVSFLRATSPATGRRAGLAGLFAAVLSSAAAGADTPCGGVLPQICPDATSVAPADTAPTSDAATRPLVSPGRKVIRVAETAAALAPGDAFPAEGRSVVMDPGRYGLAPVTGAWRYYVLDGFVYRVDSGTGRVIDAQRATPALR